MVLKAYGQNIVNILMCLLEGSLNMMSQNIFNSFSNTGKIVLESDLGSSFMLICSLY